MMKVFQNPVWKKISTKCTSLIKKAQQLPIWKDLRTKWSGVTICQTKVRQMMVLLLLAFFLLIGINGNIQASATVMTLPDTVTANKIILNGKDAGYACDPETVRTIIDEVLQDAASFYDMEITSDYTLDSEETTIAPALLSTKSELEDSIRKELDILVNAYTLSVDGASIGTLKRQEDVQKLLDDAKSQYVAEGESLENAIFQEDVKILKTPVPYGEVQDIADVEAILAEAHETVEEYTYKNGDTFWSISRAYNIDLDTLVEMNSDKDAGKLREGMIINLSYPKSLLNVVTRESIKYEESIPYETETEKDDSMFANQSKVLRNGQEGLQYIKANIVKVNGVETEREIVSSERPNEPVNKIVAKGTKKVPTAAAIARGDGRLKWPVSGHITSRFGRRWGRLHKGVDIANKKGTPIYAAESGKVIASGRQGGYGIRVEIDHGSGLKTLYAHMSKTAVSSGTSVSRGQLIGYVGSTGNSTGPHLHFEVEVNGSNKNPLNYLN